MVASELENLKRRPVTAQRAIRPLAAVAGKVTKRFARRLVTATRWTPVASERQAPKRRPVTTAQRASRPLAAVAGKEVRKPVGDGNALDVGDAGHGKAAAAGDEPPAARTKGPT